MIAQDSSGWWVPAPPGSVVSRYQRAATETLAEVYRHCTGFKTAITAGAHVGVWPRILAEQFDKVIAVEPDPVNWQCLSRNLADENRAILLNVALSSEEGQAPWARSDSNTGKHKIDRNGGTLVKTITIDSLDLPACDLICLDVEGYELKALQGANATVADFSPVILFEDRIWVQR
jgi:FkbM family methyltransferase